MTLSRRMIEIQKERRLYISTLNPLVLPVYVRKHIISLVEVGQNEDERVGIMVDSLTKKLESIEMKNYTRNILVMSCTRKLNRMRLKE